MNRDSTSSNESHVGEQQADHAFPLAVWGLWILPEPREIAGQSCNPGTLLFINGGTVLPPRLFILFLCLGKCTQLFVPVRLQRVCDETVPGIRCY
jgi:hypothetical protein